ncbi:hypothetical protein LWE61_11675 [Sphingobium sufflavum]|jgi:DNA-binding MarR family transcriptional regulator|uniref:MarR family winged helix-turn-helix transcriptional regulator n=1 Tax=Sphingobium sufflavum TaxID=1129547 RepID=UPI001F3691E5|nr:MarR family transcriptional regulator [Sphingobium sufflavum]MCE7797216.1 hypothetical protein [Sphingobium sufflavum]
MPSRGAFTEDKRDELLYSTEEAGFFFGALAAARDRFGHVTRILSREYEIGPRGPWMVGLIGRRPISPHELARAFSIGRSLVTAELAQLQAANLILYEKSAQDGRRIELSLTPTGQALRERLSRDLTSLLEQRLSGYSAEQVMATARMLRDFAEGN